MSDDFYESVARDIAHNFALIKQYIDSIINEKLNIQSDGNRSLFNRLCDKENRHDIVKLVAQTEFALDLIKNNMCNLKFIEQDVIKNRAKGNLNERK